MAFQLLSDGACHFDVSSIEMEMEMVTSIYSNVVHVPPPPSSSGNGDGWTGPHRLEARFSTPWSDLWSRVVFIIETPYGYPFVFPNLSVKPEDFSSKQPSGPSCVPPEDVARSLSKFVKSIKDILQPTVAAGQPCMTQAITFAEEFFKDPSSITVTSAPLQSNHAKRGGTNECHPSPSQQEQQGSSNSKRVVEDSAPQQQHQKELVTRIRRLGALVLHLTSKCCQLRFPDSTEEAEDNFEYLRRYLAEETKIVSEEVNRSWNPERTLKLGFRSFMDTVGDNAQECLKWFWASSDATAADSAAGALSTIQHRYAQEFIQQKRVGAGGFAPVYVCRKKVDGRLYAVKKIVIVARQSDKALREVRTLASIEHENVVRYYDAWVEPGVDPELQEYVDCMEAEDEDEHEEEEEGAEGNSDEEEGKRNRSSSTSSRSSSRVSDMSNPLPPAQQPRARRPADAFWDESSSNSDDDDSEEADTDGTDDDSENMDSTASPSLSHHNKQPQDQPTESKYQTLYIQMELCAAKTLRHLLDSGKLSGPQGEKIAASILRQLLSVVSHVHSEDIVHRDLKPDNVLFQQPTSKDDGNDFNFGIIKVADFGLARTMKNVSLLHSKSADMDTLISQQDDSPKHFDMAAHVLEATALGYAAASVTTNCGTVLYCAPEQAFGNSYDVKVDEYSVGMIALELWLAVSGKDFRERFEIMSQVVRDQGVLPQWFVTAHPKIAEVITNLTCVDPKQRSTCDVILASSELPGEPAEVVTALSTISQHAPRMVGRIVQRLEEFALQNFRKKPPPLAAQNSLQPISVDIIRHMEFVSMLHNAVIIPFVDPLLPLASSLRETTREPDAFLVDEKGRCFFFSRHPQLPVTAFLSNHRGKVQEECFSCYYTKNSRPLYCFGSVPTQSSFDYRMQPLWYLVHLLSGLEMSDTSELRLTFHCVSHIESTLSSSATEQHVDDEDQVNRERTQPVGNNTASSSHRLDAPMRVLSNSDVGEALIKLSSSVGNEEVSMLRDFLFHAFGAIQSFFGRSTSTPKIAVFVAMDHGSLLPDAPVDVELITSGVYFDVAYHYDVSHHHHQDLNRKDRSTASNGNGARQACTLAVGTFLQPFSVVFSLYHAMSAMLLTLDISNLQFATKRVTRCFTSALTEGIVLAKQQETATGAATGGGGGSATGEGAATMTPYEPLVEAACKLWNAGFRVLLRSKVSSKEQANFREGALSRQFSWWLTDAFKLFSIFTVSGKHLRHDVALESVAQDVKGILLSRILSLGHQAQSLSSTALGSTSAALAGSGGGMVGAGNGASSLPSSTAQLAKVEFVGKEDSNAVNEAREMFQQALHQIPNTILAVNCSSAEMRQCFYEWTDAGGSSSNNPNAATTSPALTAAMKHHGTGIGGFVDWLKRYYAASSCLIPVFCLVDRRLELLINQGKIRVAMKNREHQRRHNKGKSDRGK